MKILLKSTQRYSCKNIKKDQIELQGKFSKKNLLLYLFIYKTIIECVYVFSISPVYSYYGLELDINFSKYIFSTALLIIMFIFSPKFKKYTSTYLYLIMEVIIIIPTLSYYWLNNKSTAYIFVEIICMIIISMILRLNRKKIYINGGASRVFLNILFWIYVFTVVLLVIQRGGIDSRAFSFSAIYDLRAEYNMSRMSGYLLNWSAKAFTPFFFIYYLFNKNKIKVFMVVFLQILLYLSFGNKSFLLSIGLMIFIYFIMAKSKNSSKDFVNYLSLANLAALVFDKLNISTILRNILPYRLLFIPSMGQFRYYEFFSLHEKLKFSEGFIGQILSIEYNYNNPIGIVVNQFFRGENFISNGNTGVFSYAFADYGFIGMIIMSIFLGILFWFIDSTTYKLPVPLTVGALSYSTILLNDTGLLISLWTGGILLISLLLMVFNSEYRNQSYQNGYDKNFSDEGIR